MECNKISIPTIKRSIKNNVTNEELENALTKIKEELDELDNTPVEFEYENGARRLNVSHYVSIKCRRDDLIEMYNLITEELLKRRK